jgi:hypothetical protein
MFATKALGPLKIDGITGECQVEKFLRGWFYPLFVTKEEAIQSDIESGGKGIFVTLVFLGKLGEFYMPDSNRNLGKDIDPIVYTEHTTNGAENSFSRIQDRISELIVSQSPDYVVDQYPQFLVFLKAYYQFLEQNRGAQEVLQNINVYSDIDTTAEDLVEKFFKTYAYDIEESDNVNYQFLIKNIREIYKRKGTESAYRILFNIFFNETIEFFYPYTLVLRPSSGKLITPVILRVKESQSSSKIYDFENTEVVGSISKAKATVNKVIRYNIENYDVYELYLNNNSIVGTFLPEEEITANKAILINGFPETYVVRGQLFSTIKRIKPKNAEQGYSVGSDLLIQDSSGISGKAKIKSVDQYGRIKTVEIVNSGINYSSNVSVISNLPTETINGKYSIINGIVTVKFDFIHDIPVGKRISIKYSNVNNRLHNYSHSADIITVSDKRTIKFRYPGL